MIGIILNENLRLQLQNGSLVIGDTTYQNQKLLLLAEKGEFKFRPMRGVGAKRFIETSKGDELAREIRTEFITDGMTVNSIKIDSPGELIVDANYGS
jgi:hypothetical protein